MHAYETVDTDLFHLTEHCVYGQLQEEMIRDRLVVGRFDAALLEKIHLGAELM